MKPQHAFLINPFDNSMNFRTQELFCFKERELHDFNEVSDILSTENSLSSNSIKWLMLFLICLIEIVGSFESSRKFLVSKVENCE